MPPNDKHKPDCHSVPAPHRDRSAVTPGIPGLKLPPGKTAVPPPNPAPKTMDTPLPEPRASLDSVDAIKGVAGVIGGLSKTAQNILALAAFAATMGLGSILQTYASTVLWPPKTATSEETAQLKEVVQETKQEFKSSGLSEQFDKLNARLETMAEDARKGRLESDVRIIANERNLELVASGLSQLNGAPLNDTWPDEESADWEKTPVKGSFKVVDLRDNSVSYALHRTSTNWERPDK